ALDLLALLEPGEVAEDDDTDLVGVEVEREAEGAVLELEQLVGHGRRETLDVGDAVTGVGDAADLFAGGRARVVGPHVAVQGVPDLLRTDRKLRHDVFSSLPAVLWAEWVVCMVVLKASAGQVPLRLVEASEDGAVDDLVADLHADPADDVLLVDDLEHDG